MTESQTVSMDQEAGSLITAVDLEFIKVAPKASETAEHALVVEGYSEPTGNREADLSLESIGIIIAADYNFTRMGQ
jgi:hypothetical protein